MVFVAPIFTNPVFRLRNQQFLIKASQSLWSGESFMFGDLSEMLLLGKICSLSYGLYNMVFKNH